ncbi:MAG: hypothetical protein AB4290_30810 [Spirulina sp.]
MLNEQLYRTKIPKFDKTIDSCLVSQHQNNTWNPISIIIGWMKSFVEPPQIIDRIRRLENNEELTEMQKIAVREFIQMYDNQENNNLEEE